MSLPWPCPSTTCGSRPTLRTHVWVRRSTGRARGLLGRDLDLALADCEKALRGDPKSAQVLDTRGFVRLRRGEFDMAITDYDAALALRPNGAWSLYGRGLAKLGKRMTAEGKADIAAATALQPAVAEEAKAYGLAP